MVNRLKLLKRCSVLLYHEFQLKPLNVLSKYDEEIEGAKKKNFVLGAGGKYDTQEDRRMDQIRMELQQHRVCLNNLHLIMEREQYKYV